MFNGYSNPVIYKPVFRYCCVVTIAAPYAVIAPINGILADHVTAKCNFYSIGWCIGKIIVINQVIIAAAFACIHGMLARPKKKSIAAVRYRVIGENIVAALLKYKNPGAVLSAVIFTKAETSYIKIKPVVINAAIAASVHTNAQCRIKRKIIIEYFSPVAISH